MLRVLIVDDELLLRRLIKVSVDWKTLGFELIGEAEDGEETLEKVGELQPDLIIIDINIPFINGIQVSAKVREQFPNIKVIVLTGYDDFEYARGAIRAGVFRYLLKPINPEELHDALLQLREEILKERYQKNYIEQLENESKSLFEMKRNEILNNLIMGNINDDIQNLLMNYQIHIAPTINQVIVIEIEESPSGKAQEQELLKNGVQTICNEILGNAEAMCTFIRDRYIICILGKGSTEQNKNSCFEVLKTVREYLNCNVSIGIGEFYEGYEKIRFSYKEAVNALERRITEGAERIFKYISSNVEKPIKEINELSHEKMFCYFKQEDYEPLEKRKTKTSNIVAKAKDYIEIYYCNENLSLDEIADHIGVNASYLSSVFKKELKINIIEYITEMRLTKAKELIDQNNQESFSKISEQVGYSEPYYFSKCFKKKFGVTPTQYTQMKQT